MRQDMCVPCAEGFINLRVGAIIMKEGKILMAGTALRPHYLYTVGGRIKFGETAEEAVIREVYEETGVRMEIDRLGFIHENYFHGDASSKEGKLIYEIAFFFYMKVPEGFEWENGAFTQEGGEEFLCWIDPDAPVHYYPDFFRKELAHPAGCVKFFLSDERKR